jgi:pimeloyl-ACP methyl ester carboxylesterase
VLFPSREAALRLGRYSFHKSEGLLLSEAVVEYGVEVLRMPGARRAPLRAGKIASRIASNQLGNIVQDTLLIWGEQDNYFSVSQAEGAHKAIPKSQLHIISSAGHVPFYDQREEFNNILARFLISDPVSL